MKHVCTLILLVAAAVAANSGEVRAAPPKVVVSIEPLYAFASGLMDRVAIPDLLVRGEASPHDYRLRPSQKRKLAEADLVIWVGNGLDDFMAEAVAGLPPTTRVIKVTDLDLPVKLPLRTTDLWEKTDLDEEVGIDPHVWLDTDNAAAIVDVIARALTELDREHKIDYSRNSETVDARLGGLHRQLRRAFEPFRDSPFIVQHDAFQYLENRYGLEALGAVMTASGNEPPAPDHVAELLDEAEALDAHCLTAQPQFDRAIADAVAAEGDFTVVEMDPLHANGRGLDAYFEMMRTLPKALAACLR
jgi:zinc transport system substrate-binding protein